nr:TetR/AcrR family transcriptional regulator [Brevibacterium sp. 50QC2O2]
MAARRSGILEAAATVLVDSGAVGFSTTEVCRVASVSMGNLYAYFPSKAELLLALGRELLTKRDRMFEASTWRVLRGSIVNLIDFLRTDDGHRAARLDIELSILACSQPRLAHELAEQRLDMMLERTVRNLGASVAEAEQLVGGLTSLIAGWTYLVAIGQGMPAGAIGAVDAILGQRSCPE